MRWLGIALFAAGCLPSRDFELVLEPETETLVYLLVSDCGGTLAIDERGGCVQRDDRMLPIFVRPSTVTLPLNVGREDRVFIAEYLQEDEALGIPLGSRAIEDGQCPNARSFPAPLRTWRIDPLDGQDVLDTFPSAWSLPAFDYAACFQSGGCLGLGEAGVPICNQACGSPNLDPPEPPEVGGAPSEDWPVEVCANGWFDLATNACQTIEAPCDAQGWPMSPPAGAAYVATGTSGAFLGTRAAPYTSVDQARNAVPQPQVVLLHAGTPHLVAGPVSWSVRMIGCKRENGALTRFGTGLSPQPALIVAGAGVTVTAESIAFENGIRVEGAELVLQRSTIRITPGAAIEPGLSLDGGAASLSEVAVESSTVAALALVNGARLDADRLYVTGELGIRADGSTLSLVDSSFRNVFGTDALYAFASEVTLTRVAMDTICRHAVHLHRSNATIAELRVARLGRHLTQAQDASCGTGNGLRVFGASEVTASRVRITAPRRTEGASFNDAFVVGEGATLSLADSTASAIHKGLKAVDSEITFDGVSFEETSDSGLMLAGTIAELRSVSTSGANPGLAIESSTVTGSRIAIVAAGGRAIAIERADVCASGGCYDSIVDLSDVDASAESSAPGTGLFVDNRSAEPMPVRFTRARLSGFNKVVEHFGGVLELEHAHLEPALDGTVFDLQAFRALTLRLRNVRVVGGIVFDLERPAVIEAIDTELVTSDRVLDLNGICDTDLPHRLLQGVRVTNPRDEPIAWPQR